MKSLSFWAGRNVGISRVLLTIVLTVFTVLSILIGIYISLSGYTVSGTNFALFLTALFMPVIILYPTKREIRKLNLAKSFFSKWKIYDFALIVLISLSSIGLGNYSGQNQLSELNTIAAVSYVVDAMPTLEIAGSGVTNKSTENSVKKLIDLVQKNVIQFVREVKSKADTKSNVLNTLIIVLLLISYLALLYIALLFACGIACNGYELAAILFALGVQAGLIVGFYFSIRSLLKKRNLNNGKEDFSKFELRKRSLIFSLIVLVFPIILMLLASL